MTLNYIKIFCPTAQSEFTWSLGQHLTTFRFYVPFDYLNTFPQMNKYLN